MAASTYTLKALYQTRTRKVETDDGRGMRTIPDGSETADIELTIDLDAIARRLGSKAMRNKTNRASMMWGLVKVKASNRRRSYAGA